MVKNPPANTGDVRDTGLVPGLGRSPGGGHGHPLQYSCLENPMDRGAWQALRSQRVRHDSSAIPWHVHEHKGLPFDGFGTFIIGLIALLQI